MPNPSPAMRRPIPRTRVSRATAVPAWQPGRAPRIEEYTDRQALVDGLGFAAFMVLLVVGLYIIAWGYV